MGGCWRGNRILSMVFKSVYRSTLPISRASNRGSILGSTTVVGGARYCRVCVIGCRIMSMGHKALV